MSDSMIRDINIQVARLHIDLASALLWLVCLPWYSLGWLAGFGVRCVLWIVAAVVAGYQAGRGA